MKQADVIDLIPGCHVDDGNTVAQIVGHIVLRRVRVDARGDRQGAGGRLGLDLVRDEVPERGVIRIGVRGHHRFSVMAHPMGMRLCLLLSRALHLDLAVDGQGAIVGLIQFNHHIFPVHSDVDLFFPGRIPHPGHHVGGIFTEHDFLQESAVLTIMDVQTLAVPLGVVDLFLVFAGPEVVGVVHFLVRQRDLALHRPFVGPFHIDHGHRARVGSCFAGGLLILRIDPYLADSVDGGILNGRDGFAIKCALKCRIKVGNHGAARHADRNGRIDGLILFADLGVVLPVRWARDHEKCAQ